MKAAVVTDFDTPPRYLDFPDPVAHGKDEVVVAPLETFRTPEPRVPDPVVSSNSTMRMAVSLPDVVMEAGAANANVTEAPPAS